MVCYYLFSRYLYMTFLFKTYQETIDPENSYNIMFSKNVLTSIFFHVVIYFYSFVFFTKIFKISYLKESKSYDTVLYSLIAIMTLGYFGRMARSKSIYNYYKEQGLSKHDSKKLAIDYINTAYFKWYFLG